MISAINTTQTTERSATTDILSESMRNMRIGGNLLLNDIYHSPWAISIPDKTELGASLAKHKNTHIAAFHLVKEGQITIELKSGEREVLCTGELVICFSGQSHLIYHGDKSKIYAFENFMQGKGNIFAPTNAQLAQLTAEQSKVEHNKEERCTQLICGVFMMQDTDLNPLFDALPPLMKVSTITTNDSTGVSANNIIDLLLAEIDKSSFSHQFMIERYLELLCAMAINRYIETATMTKPSWFKAVKDPMISRVLSAIHDDPAYDWSVKNMANIIALSPSRFSAKYTETTGFSPMAYVTRWRMYLASKLLKETQFRLEQIATQLGYDNVSVFSRAFKRNLGTSPGAWRLTHKT